MPRTSRQVRTSFATSLAAVTALVLAGCGDDLGRAAGPDVGTLEVALMAAPADVRCLKVTVAGSRSVNRLFDVTPGASTVFSIDRLPIGFVQVDAAAFSGACTTVGAAAVPAWVSEGAVNARIDTTAVAQALIRLIRNGRLSVGVDFEDPPWVSASTAPIDLAVIGDSPYGAAQLPTFPDLVAVINADPRISGVVHLGDIKNGSTRCDTTYFQTILGYLNTFADGVVYTPGDNEWTDCHRANNGAYDPLERLEVLRRTFFPFPGLALGGARKQTLSQGSLPGFETFVENQLWFESSVTFATLHVVGSNNNLAPWFGDDTTGTKMDDPARRLAEVAARTAANLDWLDRTFALARSRNAAGVVLMMQANSWSTGASNGFDSTIQRLADLARAFAKPVLVIQGDTHVYLVDNPLATGDPVHGVMAPVPNVTRIVVQGETTSEWLRLHVDPAAAAPFTWERNFR